MRGVWKGYLAILLVGIFVMTPMSIIVQNNESTIVLTEQSEARMAVAGDSSIIDLTSNPSVGLGFTIDVPQDEPITQIEMEIKPSPLETRDGLAWEGASAWNHPDSTSSGVGVDADGMLTAQGGGTEWNFNSGNDGWTFSNSYSGRVTTPACGYNGSTAGSIRTYAGSTYATSPIVDLSGATNMPLHAWIRQGSSGCGEEPDSNENLAVQYRNNAGGWTTLQTWQGSTSGGGVTQYAVNLPSAAFHSSFQVRFHQNSGSGTCCDYWFFDDVKLAAPLQASWLSPSFGWAGNSTIGIEPGAWADMQIDAKIPAGADIRWTVIDDFTNESISYLANKSGNQIPLSTIDWSVHQSLRISLELIAGSNNQMPIIRGIYADGSFIDSLDEDPMSNGWTGNASWGPRLMSTFTSHSLKGNISQVAISPWYETSMPLNSLTMEIEGDHANVYYRTDENSPWINSSVTLQNGFSQVLVTSNASSIMRYQMKFESEYVGSNFSNGTTAPLFEIASMKITESSGRFPVGPYIDLNDDGNYDWGGSNEKVGSWGWQNYFSNGKTSTNASAGFSGLATTSVWIPRSNIHSFGFSVYSDISSISGVNILIGGGIFSNYSYTNASIVDINFNTTELSQLTNIISSLPAISVNGEAFVELDLEILGTGSFYLSNLYAPYDTSSIISENSNGAFVMSLNSVRDTAGVYNNNHLINLTMGAVSQGSVIVEINTLQSVSSIQTGWAQMADAPAVLAPSQQWQNMTTRFSSLPGLNSNMVRLDFIGTVNQATWFLPIAGGSPVGQGASDLVEIHPSGVQVVENGNFDDTSVNFRLKQGWDDDQFIRVEMRTILSNGVHSLPGVYTWEQAPQGYENDLEIKSWAISDVRGNLPSDTYFLKAGELINFSIDVGFEGIDDEQAFAPGEGLVELIRGDTVIANTTTLDGDIWNVTDTVPFSLLETTWTVQVTSLDGGQKGENWMVNRTFQPDPTNPEVLSVDIQKYDHRITSQTQTIEIQVLDYVKLPSDVQMMVWREWADDRDFNGWPSEDEYNPMSVYLPSDLDASIGTYTFVIDDTIGIQGEKVAGYMVGVDDSGRELKLGGSGKDGEHLFMYQLGPDGAPITTPDGFNWVDGRKSWLHPEQVYSVDVTIGDANGVSDLDTVEVNFAGNQLANPLKVTWTYEDDMCNSHSDYLIVLDCEIIGQNGEEAHPFERTAVLNIEFKLDWTTPDLGENRREPSVVLIDRAGKESIQTYPESRWRFSPALSIPEETVFLHLSQGVMLADGARILPNSFLEISGDVVFHESGEIPQFDCRIDLLMGGRITSTIAVDGEWTTELYAPPTSGSTPLTWSVSCLGTNGIDATDKSTSVRWMIVDGFGPIPSEIEAPIQNTIISNELIDVTILLSEEGGVDRESLELVWRVEDAITGEALRNGREPMSLQGQELTGLRLMAVSSIDLSVVDDSMLSERLTLVMEVEGRDLAGNTVRSFSETSLNNRWSMEWYKPEFSFDAGAVTYSKLDLELGDKTFINVEVNNVGDLDGTEKIDIYIVDENGNSDLLRTAEVEVPTQGVASISVDWEPTTTGIQWVEARSSEGEVSIGPSVDVRPQPELSLNEQVFGQVNPALGSLLFILIIAVISAFMLLMFRATKFAGSEEEIDWEDYADEVDEEFENEISVAEDDAFAEDLPQETSQEVNQAVNEIDNTEAPQSDSGWFQGSDGRWWWHDKQNNEWWYQDENGNQVKL